MKLDFHSDAPIVDVVSLICRSLRWLGELLVVREGHISTKLDQDGLHCEVALPLRQARQL